MAGRAAQFLGQPFLLTVPGERLDDAMASNRRTKVDFRKFPDNLLLPLRNFIVLNQCFHEEILADLRLSCLRKERRRDKTLLRGGLQNVLAPLEAPATEQRCQILQ